MSIKYEYDVAISFAEKERDAALAMALALELAGFKNVYYYPDHLGETAGHLLMPTLTTVYSSKCKYIVVMLSDKYLKGKTSIKELKVIHNRLKQNLNIRIVIPVLLKDKIDLSDFPLLAKITYIKWGFDPKRVAQILKSDLGARQSGDLGDLLAKEEAFLYKIEQTNSAEIANIQSNTVHFKL